MAVGECCEQQDAEDDVDVDAGALAGAPDGGSDDQPKPSQNGTCTSP